MEAEIDFFKLISNFVSSQQRSARNDDLALNSFSFETIEKLLETFVYHPSRVC